MIQNVGYNVFDSKSNRQLEWHGMPHLSPIFKKGRNFYDHAPVGYKQYNGLLVSNFKTPRAKSVTRKMGGPPRSETFSTIKNK